MGTRKLHINTKGSLHPKKKTYRLSLATDKGTSLNPRQSSQVTWKNVSARSLPQERVNRLSSTGAASGT